MTSINCLTDNEFAYLTADTAVYDCERGTIMDFVPKVLMLEPLRMALAFTGRWFGMEAVVEALDRHAAVTIEASQQTILDAIVPALRDLDARSVADGRLVAGEGAAIGVTVAMFDEVEDRPRILYAYADGMTDAPIADPFVLTEIPGIVAPRVPDDRQDEIWPAGHLKLPRREMRQLVEYQRTVEIAHVGGCGLGGTVQFYRIGRDGIYVDDLIQFPEQVGDRLDGALAGKPIASRMDMAFAV